MSVWPRTLIYLVQNSLFQFKELHLFIVLACVVSPQQEQHMLKISTLSFLQRFLISNLQCMALWKSENHAKQESSSLSIFQQQRRTSWIMWNGSKMILPFITFQKDQRAKEQPMVFLLAVRLRSLNVKVKKITATQGTEQDSIKTATTETESIASVNTPETPNSQQCDSMNTTNDSFNGDCLKTLDPLVWVPYLSPLSTAEAQDSPYIPFLSSSFSSNPVMWHILQSMRLTNNVVAFYIINTISGEIHLSPKQKCVLEC